MAWLEFHDTLPDHWKIEQLAHDLGVEKAQALGHVTALWLRVIRFKPSGNLFGMSHAVIARWALFGGDPEKFIKCLIDNCLIDKKGKKRPSLSIHDWAVYTKRFKKVEEAKERDRKRKRKKAPLEFRGNSEGTPEEDSGIPEEFHVDRTGPTGPDKTDQNGPDKNDAPPSPENLPSPKSQASGSVAAEIASKYRQMNPGIISQAKAVDFIEFWLSGGMNAEVALERVMSPANRGTKIWDLLESLVKNKGPKHETYPEKLVRFEAEKKAKAKKSELETQARENF